MSTKPPKPSAALAVALGAITLISPLAVHLFLPAIPAVKRDLALTDAMAQLTFSAAVMSLALSTLFYGTAADRLGRRPTLLSGLVLFLIGSALSAFAANAWMLVLGRIVQAAGAGCSITLVRTIARDVYGQQDLVKAIAYLTMAYALGPIMSPAIGGLLIDTFGWRYLFAFAIATGAVILVASAILIRETRPPGAAASIESERWQTSYRALFSSPRFSLLVFQTGLCSATFMATATAASVLMQELLRRPASEFGLYFAMIPTGLLIGSTISSRLRNRIAIESMVLAGSLLIASAVAVQAVLLLSGIVTPLTLCLPGMFITMSNGLAMPSAQAGAMAVIPRYAGTAAGIGVFMQMMMSGIAAQLYGLIANGTVVPMIITSGLCAAGALVTGLAVYLMGPPKP